MSSAQVVTKSWTSNEQVVIPLKISYHLSNQKSRSLSTLLLFRGVVGVLDKIKAISAQLSCTLEDSQSKCFSILQDLLFIKLIDSLVRLMLVLMLGSQVFMYGRVVHTVGA